METLCTYDHRSDAIRDRIARVVVSRNSRSCKFGEQAQRRSDGTAPASRITNLTVGTPMPSFVVSEVNSQPHVEDGRSNATDRRSSFPNRELASGTTSTDHSAGSNDRTDNASSSSPTIATRPGDPTVSWKIGGHRSPPKSPSRERERDHISRLNQDHAVPVHSRLPALPQPSPCPPRVDIRGVRGVGMRRPDPSSGSVEGSDRKRLFTDQ